VALRQEEFTHLCDDVDLDRDRILVERCQAGDSGAFGSLYARYYERLLRFCLRRLHDRHEAEDAAQEAFARAWKALPNFAGERRFYPWLTVIAGNICTDMLRRRSRSTPTEDLELGARTPVGATATATADETIIAAADGDLAHKALDRLSVRHRHVLALREDSGWTYQQIADHEGVEIGTIETLLWRARQALKREFLALSESKGPFAGFLMGVGAAIKTVFVRSAHRVATLQPGGGGGVVRNAFAGFAVTSAAVAAAFIAPHALDSSRQAQVAPPAPAAAGVAGSRLSAASATPSARSVSGGLSATTSSDAPAAGVGATPANSGAGTGGGPAGLDPGLTPSGGGLLSGASKSAATPVAGLGGQALSLLPQGLLKTITSGASTLLPGMSSGAMAGPPAVTNLVPATVGTITAAIGGLRSAVASVPATLAPALAPAGPAASTTPASTTTTTTVGPASPLDLGNVTSSVISALHLLGQG
jgi:RNA polymerase sigma-70 factor (ECF subfamily)